MTRNWNTGRKALLAEHRKETKSKQNTRTHKTTATKNKNKGQQTYYQQKN